MRPLATVSYDGRVYGSIVRTGGVAWQKYLGWKRFMAEIAMAKVSVEELPNGESSYDRRAPLPKYSATQSIASTYMY
ncbi:unnamed protein product [Toxocara canis]|uniref:TonB-dependent receptor n=1 Tax=Toxocara canis TaxID=6265 RepID=A0A183V4V9_TOXCA|nr:unnamed protein product [Toxocara canis]